MVRLCCRFTRNPCVRGLATFGHRVTGRGVPIWTTITGCPERGCWLRKPGFLWTPGYWGFSTGLYYWHPGYWGLTVGFYGGINYGWGYPGYGYYGGYWHGRDFYYNRTVNNINITNVRNVYNQPVANNFNATRVAYNGGPGGVQARATQAQLAAERQRHMAATSAQLAAPASGAA